MNRVTQIPELGQRIWLDFIDRQLINTVALQTLLRKDGIRGLTSSPAILSHGFACLTT